MRVCVPKEIEPGEQRVALVPALVSKLTKAGIEVLVESGAGEASLCSDRDYQEAGATIVPDPGTLLGQAEVVLKVQRPLLNVQLGCHEVDLMAPGAVIISFFLPSTDPDLVSRLVERKLTCFSLDLLPRISRAQPMDARSAMSTIAGYKAVLLAANAYSRLFPMMSTAAGTVAPAKVLILGAGVAGLQAIATARRLGAVVSAFDVRPAVRQEVESLGARFLALDVTSEADASGYAKGLAEEDERRQRELMTKFVKEADIIITTALVPGKKAPVLITGEMVAQMKPGSQIVDLAAEQGGNCELSQAGVEVTTGGVMIHGPVNLPASMPVQASNLYARTITAFLLNMVKDKALDLGADDQIVRESCVVRDGEIVAAAAALGQATSGG
ncbi:MAG: Re/Si-specific NAD(P)(+) transhydrogenase subunit alpha [bacterium]|nr:Re/Si-specific NAD(P)(+) transhydrogenase subunit alpha [bacterium]